MWPIYNIRNTPYNNDDEIAVVIIHIPDILLPYHEKQEDLAG